MVVILDIILDSLLDSLKILPVIFLVYVLIEFLESRESTHERMEKIFVSRFSPFFGAAVGVIPQCGFSVVATKLYQGGYILAGTLIAVYLATSDEALPILFSRAITNPEVFLQLGLLISIKFVYAVIAGFLINMFVKKQPRSFDDADRLADDKDDDMDGDGCCHHHIAGKRTTVKTLLLHPLLHSLKIILYVFLISAAFGVFVEYAVGEEALKNFLSSSVLLQPLVSSLIGLIPNCASSVLITETYAEGYLSLGAALSGLAVNSGIGMAVLLKDKANIKRSLAIIGLTFALALALGYLVTGIQLIFGF